MKLRFLSLLLTLPLLGFTCVTPYVVKPEASSASLTYKRNIAIYDKEGIKIEMWGSNHATGPEFNSIIENISNENITLSPKNVELSLNTKVNGSWFKNGRINDIFSTGPQDPGAQIEQVFLDHSRWNDPIVLKPKQSILISHQFYLGETGIPPGEFKYSSEMVNSKGKKIPIEVAFRFH